MRPNHKKKVREKSRECHIHKPQPFPDPKRKRKPTNPNKHKPNKRTKSTKISSLFPKRGNRNTKRTEKHKNKMTHGKTYNKSPRRINHKATKSKTTTELPHLTLPLFFLFICVFIAFCDAHGDLSLHRVHVEHCRKCCGPAQLLPDRIVISPSCDHPQCFRDRCNRKLT